MTKILATVISALFLSASSAFAGTVLEGSVSFGAPTGIQVVTPSEGVRGEIIVGANHLPLTYASADTYAASFQGSVTDETVMVILNPAHIAFLADQSPAAYAKENNLLNAFDFKCTRADNAFVWYVTHLGVYANCARLRTR